MNRSQKGFTAIEGLLVIILVGILGFTGWFVWQSQQKLDHTNNDMVKNAYNVSKKAKVTAPASKQKEVSKPYLIIKEWGVKMPLTNTAVQHAVYTVAPSTAGSVERITLSTTEIQNNPTTANAGISLYRAKTKEALVNAGVQYPASSFIQVNDYYYVLQPSTGFDNAPEADIAFMEPVFAHGKGFDLVWQMLEKE